MNDPGARERFLVAISTHLPADRVVEMHLFAALRQGGIESGVAVIAVDPERTVPPEGEVVTAVEAAPAVGAPPVALRYTVYSARYRHTIKGPDRGKWEASVIEEADAPLDTVDAVVRGVSRRSGDADESVRLSGDEYRALLSAIPAVPVALRIVPRA